MSAGKIIIALIVVVFLLIALLAPRAMNDIVNFLRDLTAGHGVSVK